MPPDLVERINASLRQEAELRKNSQDNVTYALFAGRTTRSHHGRSWQVAAGAAIFLTATAAAVAGLGGSGEGLVGMLSSPLQKASPAASSSATSAPNAFVGQNLPSKDKASAARGTPVFKLSTGGYSARTLLEQAKALSQESSVGMSEGAPESPHIGPIGTPLGLSSCLKALGLPGDSRAVVDISTYEGKPSAVIVTRVGEHDQVHVVKRSCSEGSPELMVGPYSL
ncbi:hypothetical protein SAMN05421595_2916 [Austwickia chelonae]|uniref:Uncharacterized protein n=1 Tax=Austwickia chelonae NBRC 105200 TaxID=1184607 RepID=K6UNL0_9MICO|nr:hypothetical protein [Austwickia chelonae]GAB79056.1 hypothetical protein AUCHE_18_00570 [Austwickia chelonae NBRC 105200]SEW41941.1 hypothetical protein SAMN05421595_2916 [Austwickia chelonae]